MSSHILHSRLLTCTQNSTYTLFLFTYIYTDLHIYSFLTYWFVNWFRQILYSGLFMHKLTQTYSLTYIWIYSVFMYKLTKIYSLFQFTYIYTCLDTYSILDYLHIHFPRHILYSGLLMYQLTRTYSLFWFTYIHTDQDMYSILVYLHIFRTRHILYSGLLTYILTYIWIYPS